MAKTSSEVKARWNAKTYKRYPVYLRKDEDAELIEWIEANKGKEGTTALFRAGIEALRSK